MKTLSQFLEATERDLKDMGASERQVAELKRRQAERKKRGIDKGFTVGDDRNKTTASSARPSTRTRTRGQKALPPAKGSAIVKRPTSTTAMANRSADKGSALVKSKQQKATPKPKPKAKPEDKKKQVAKAAAAGAAGGAAAQKLLPPPKGRTLTPPTGGDLKKPRKPGKPRNRFGRALGKLGRGVKDAYRQQKYNFDGSSAALQGDREIIRGERR